MPLDEIREAIATVMNTVPAIGVVTAFDPLTTRKEDFERYFKTAAGDEMLGWAITRESTVERDGTTEQNLSEHVMVIRGYHAIGNFGATEPVFQDLVETLRARLRREQRDQLAGAATFVGPPSVRIFEPRRFETYLVHYVEIVLRCTEVVPIA
jgi:hypothetical protein